MKNIVTIAILFQCLIGWNKEIKNEIFDNSVVLIDDFLWVSKTEVSNKQYREFLAANKNNPIYRSLLPDTNQWGKEINHAVSYIEYYFRHPAYTDYPVVCVSKQQATGYCNWLSEKLNSKLANDLENEIGKVTVRLPTEWEWKYAAKGGLSKWNEYPWNGNSLRIIDGKHQGKFRLNFKRKNGDFLGAAGNLSDNADITAPVKSYWPNGYGLYNMCGNVSEMVADNNYAYGGNWSSTGFNVRISSAIKNNPSPKIGFRYVIEVTQWKNKNQKKKELITKKYLNDLFISINDSIKMMKTEVTNELYNCFLSDEKHQRPDSTAWDDQFWYSNQYRNKYHWHPDYNNYPVVNIAKKDVELFVKWLTQVYRKHTNQELTIRLPNELEWMLAARPIGNKSTYYPWGGLNLTNAKGCYLCNFRTYPEIYTSEDDVGNVVYKIPENEDPMIGADLDGLKTVGPVFSYYPNNHKLFNMSGNVAEMIHDQNITKGGSWKSDSEKVTINSKEIYKSNQPTIGFRLIIKNGK